AEAPLIHRLRLAKEALVRKTFDEATANIEYVRREARSAHFRNEAEKMHAYTLFVLGDVEGASALVERLPAGVEIDDALLGAIYPHQRRWADAVVVLYDGFEENPTDATAAQLAHALLKLGRLDEVRALAEAPAAGPGLFHELMSALFYAGRYHEAA